MLMAVYTERRSTLPGGVIWTRTPEPAGAHSRVLPDGCMDLIWHDGRLLVAGPDTSAEVVHVGAGSSFTGLRFAPGFAPAVLGVPGHVLRDTRVELDAIWPAAEARELAELVGSARDRGAALEDAARLRLGRAGPVAAWTRDAVRQLGGASVAAVAGSLGYRLKTLARVLRMTRALDLARSGEALASVAVAAGYADQLHFARDVKLLAGVPISELLAGQAGRPGAERRRRRGCRRGR